MPNFDGGHYFLSALVPVRRDLCTDPAYPDRVHSHVHALREILAALPTENDPLAPAPRALLPPVEASRLAPFSRDLRTHFARLVVVDDVAFNGRQHQDAIVSRIKAIDPVIPGLVDHLAFSYLAVIIDFDASDGSPQTLESYLRGLWRVMAPELIAVFEHCQGFDPEQPENSFVAQLMQSQVETTMSYNDYYWRGEPGFWQGSSPLVSQLRNALLFPLLVAAGLLLALLWKGIRGWVLLFLLLLLLAGAVLWIARNILAAGRKPFAAAPRSDLISVLKALYLQQKFIRFIINHQSASPKRLQQDFGSFLVEHQPANVAVPSQHAGTVPY